MENYDVIIKNEFGVEAKLEEGNVWLCQKDIEHLFGRSHSNVSEHIKNIFYLKNKMKIQFVGFSNILGQMAKIII